MRQTHLRLRFLSAWQDLVLSFIDQVPAGSDGSDIAGRRIQNWIYAWDLFAASETFPGLRPGAADQILESLRGQDRVVNFGTRLAINSDFTTILVRKLPSGREAVERLRDLLSIMIGGLDTRLVAMQSAMLLDLRREVLTRVLTATRDNLGKLDELHKQQKHGAAEIMTALGVEVEKSVLRLDFTQQQETALMKVIESTATRINSVYDEGLKLDEQFEGIIDELSGALDE